MPIQLNFVRSKKPYQLKFSGKSIESVDIRVSCEETTLHFGWPTRQKKITYRDSNRGITVEKRATYSNILCVNCLVGWFIFIYFRAFETVYIFSMEIESFHFNLFTLRIVNVNGSFTAHTQKNVRPKATRIVSFGSDFMDGVRCIDILPFSLWAQKLFISWRRKKDERTGKEESESVVKIPQ